ncbi:helix-turn-helix domain-containing protein [Halorubellus salinus]|uniref:helix-turn-helix domain-containing protein n=1 Tax=Halorubellus salinus TaxID=755309 RepID=UPI001D08681C|nr:helix-turn-helix domain-containing protein [Halorubellus salinus]
MYEATFHIRGDVAYEDATAGRDVDIELWCNDHCDLLHVRGDTNGAVVEEVSAAVGVEDTIERGDEQIIITSECLRPHTEQNVEGYLERHDCLLLPPLRYENGGKLVRVLTLDPENLTRFYQDIQDSFHVTVRSKREIDSVTQDRPLLSVDTLIPELSDRQEEAVVSAWEEGYYAIPRETTTEELATALDIDRRTFEEHLRIAENKLVGTLVEQLFA